MLHATDLGEGSRRAFDFALAVALRHGAGLSLLHVAPRPPTLPPPEILDLAVRASDAGVRAEPLLATGDVAAALLAEARTGDTLVMGSGRRRSPADWSLGSVTKVILRTPPVPVLIVPPAGPPPGPPETLFRRVLCPVDFSAAEAPVLSYALDWSRGGRLTLLHVLEWFPEEGRADCRIPELGLDLSEETRHRMRRLVPEEARPWCEREEVVLTGRPHRQILRVAGERRVDLIALALRRRRALDKVLAGGTLVHVLREAACPVLAVGPGLAPSDEPSEDLAAAARRGS